MKKKKIETLDDLKRFPFEEIRKWRKMGQKTLDEIIDVLNDYKQEEIVIDKDFIKNVQKNISDYNFSKRALNIFELKSIKTLEDLQQYSVDEIKNWRKIGKKTLDEIINILNINQQEISPSYGLTVCVFESIISYKIYKISLDSYIKLQKCKNFSDINRFLESQNTIDYKRDENIDVFVFQRDFCNSDFYIFCEKISKEYSVFVKTKNDNIAHIVLLVFSYLILKNKTLEDDLLSLKNTELIKIIFSNNQCFEIIKEKILTVFDNTFSELSTTDLKNIFPDFIQSTGIIESALFDLEKSKLIRKTKNENYELILPSVKDFISDFKDEKIKDILTRRFLEGQSLDEIGQAYNLSRERVRQIVYKNFTSRVEQIKFKEDSYAYIFKKYNLNKEQAKLIFGDAVAYYFTVRYESGIVNIEEALEDNSIPQNIRKKIRSKIIYADCIYVGNQYIKKYRPALYNYYIRNYCTANINIDLFIQKYSEFWEKQGIEKDLYSIDKRTFQGHILKAKNILYKYPSSFRFYDYEQYDFTDLLDILDLDQYENVILSTAKFMKEYPKVMKKYDIRDEYELHSLLRNLLEETSKYIKFHRMPTVEFGYANIDKQVVDLLEEYSPISSVELARLYEKQYGTYFKTALGSYFNCISKYLHRGVYTINFPDLTTDEFNYLKMQLTDDFYTINSVKEIFSKKYAELSHINPYTLKKLGFIVNENHIVQGKFESASLYFKYLLLKNEKFQYSDIIPEIRKNVNFNSVLNSLLDNYELLEYSKRQYINFSKFISFGITKSDFSDFCKQVYALELPEFFTLNQIKQIKFAHKLFELGFDDWFYAGILSRNDRLFSTQQIGGVLVLSKANKNITWGALLKSIIPENGMDIYKLVDILNERFSMQVSKYDVLARIDDSDLYYDKIMEKLYCSYDNYFEEI